MAPNNFDDLTHMIMIIAKQPVCCQGDDFSVLCLVFSLCELLQMYFAIHFLDIPSRGKRICSELLCGPAEGEDLQLVLAYSYYLYVMTKYFPAGVSAFLCKLIIATTDDLFCTF